MAASLKIQWECDECGKSFPDEAAAVQCHAKTIADYSRVKHPPDPNCELCGLAQKFGRVAFCICMTE